MVNPSDYVIFISLNRIDGNKWQNFDWKYYPTAETKFIQRMLKGLAN